MEGETIVMQDVFVFEQSGIGEDGKILGELKPTGLRPHASERIKDVGITLPASLFGEGTETNEPKARSTRR